MFKNATVLITGGSGSFGKAFAKTLLTEYPEVKKVIIFSRDELKQFDMHSHPDFVPYTEAGTNQLRFFIGDVRDLARFRRACEGVDYIVHAAALKQVPAAEYNPIECIKTNVIGAQNVIEAALDTGVKKVVALSTDKAAAPVNLYGATKLCSDKLFIAANNMVGERDLMFAIIRYGNVMGSRGSVIPLFLRERSNKRLRITHESMTRFNITLRDSVDKVIYALANAIGGEILVPKLSSYRITELASAIAPDSENEYIGIRPGEKLHEELITQADAHNTIDCGDNYIIISPAVAPKQQYIDHYAGQPVAADFSYASDNNTSWLSVKELRLLIKAHVDPTFEV